MNGWGPDQAVAEQSEELQALRRAISEARVAAELDAQLREKKALQARSSLASRLACVPSVRPRRTSGQQRMPMPLALWGDFNPSASFWHFYFP